MPSGLVDDHHAVGAGIDGLADLGAGIDGLADLGQMQFHRRDVAPGRNLVPQNRISRQTTLFA